MKTQSIKERENEKERGKKRYLERKVQEDEANAEIDNYVEEHPLFPERNDDSQPDR